MRARPSATIAAALLGSIKFIHTVIVIATALVFLLRHVVHGIVRWCVDVTKFQIAVSVTTWCDLGHRTFKSAVSAVQVEFHLHSISSFD
jgi:hypothetical protein